MRFYEIAVFTFIFNLVLGIVPAVVSVDAGISSIGGWDRTTVETGISSVNSKISQAYTPVWSELNWFVENVRLVVQGLAVISEAMFGATIGLPVLINNALCAVPGACGMFNIHPFAAFFGTMILFVYFVGMVQFMTGRSYKEAQ